MISSLLLIDYLSGVEVDQEQQFMVDTKGAGGQGQLEVVVVSLSSCLMFFTLVIVSLS